MKKYFFLFCLLTSSVFANDFTGTYQCEGNDGSEGTYQGEVVMKKIPEFSKDNYASYDFVLKVPGFGDYHGFASANGLDVAIYFALDDRKNEDYGVGIAKFKQSENQAWSFHKFYFEPGYKGGNTGFEDCIQVKK